MEACAGCGNTRQVAFRDRQGRPRCSTCPDRDTRDPLLVLVGVITRTDPGLPAEAVTAAIEATVTKQAHLQKLAWLLQDKPELLTGGGAGGIVFPIVLVPIYAVPRAFLVRKGQADSFEEVPLSLTTVWFFPHRERLVVVYHGQARLAEEDASDIERAVLGADRLGALRPAADFHAVMMLRVTGRYQVNWYPTL